MPGRVGGGETYLGNLSREMAGRLRRDETLVFFCTEENARLFPEAGPGVEVVRVRLPRRIRPARLIAEHLVLPLLLRGRGIDVVLCPGNSVMPLAGVRQVMALQSMHYLLVGEEMARSRVRYFRTMVPLSAGRAAKVICVSEDLRRTLLGVVPQARSKCSVVYEGADLDAFSPGEVGDGQREGLLYVSSLNPFKRPDSLVRALAHLRRDGFEPPPAVLCGRPDPADEERVRRLAESEGVADLVRIEGVVAHEALPGLYRSSACLVYPSAVETFGLPPLEAMACGCPVIASNRTSVPEVVGDAAIVVDPDDIPALATAIRSVLTDESLRASLRERGYANLARFQWETAAEQTLAILRAAAF